MTPGVTDVHVHIQPWRQLKPAVMEAMRRGKEDHWDFLMTLMDDPKALLDVMDKSGIWRVGIVNYVSPDLTIIMAHGGRPLWMDEAFFILRRHQNVLLDVSGIPPLKLTEYFPRLAEIGDRVLWGTDWPSPGVRDLKHNLDQFLSLNLSHELKNAVTRTNPLRVFPVQ